MTQRQLAILAAKIAGLVLLVFLAIRLSGEVRQALELDTAGAGSSRLWWLLSVGLTAYAVLTAIPFVPGAEMGMALLAAMGGTIAPAVYVATVLALGLAFAIGRFVHPDMTVRGLRFLRLRKAADHLQAIAALPEDQVIPYLLGKTNPGLAQWLVRYRYLALIALINLPGSIVIGGGGGIAMAAGLSRVFTPLGFAVSILIGVLPVPLAFFLFPMSG